MLTAMANSSGSEATPIKGQSGTTLPQLSLSPSPTPAVCRVTATSVLVASCRNPDNNNDDKEELEEDNKDNQLHHNHSVIHTAMLTLH